MGAAVLLGLLAATAGAEDRIYCDEETRATHERVEARAKRLVPGETQTLNPGGKFSFQVKCKERLSSHYRLEMLLQRDDQPLAIIQMLIARDRPVVVLTPEKKWRLWVD